MKIIALTAPGKTPDSKQIGELGEEDRKTWELSNIRVVREAAETTLSPLSFYRNGFIRFDLIPVGPFTNFARLFS